MERGRPRNFDKEHALEAALAVFWREGYLGASMTELTEAMGISKPSLYAAFGNKEQLYLEALALYRQQQLFRHAEALVLEPELKPAMRRFLRSVAGMLTAPELPGGCLVVNCAVACEARALPPDVAGAISQTINEDLSAILHQRLLEGMQRRDSLTEADAGALADYTIAVMSGMAVLSRVGTERERLFEVIERALCAFPD